MITRIELNNFMSHEHTVIEPACGLTVIAGPNNCGKSAIVTALQILCYNDESTFVMRHGEKECSIKIFTDDGHEIEWNRTKSKSTKYIIDGQQHDRLGRGGTPDELHKILKIQKVSCDNQEFDVHFGAQQNPVFLLNDSPRAAAQFFASSSDAINLIAMQTRHKQKVRDRKQEKRRLATELEEVGQKLERLETVPDLSNRLMELEKTYQEIRHQDEEIAALHNLVNAIQEKSTQLGRLRAQVDAVQELKSPPNFVDTNPLEALLSQINRNKYQLNKTKSYCRALGRLEETPTLNELESLKALIEAIRLVRQHYLVAKQKSASLASLKPCPQQGDTEKLEESIDGLTQSFARFESAEKQLQVCENLTEPPKQTSPMELERSLAELVRQHAELNRLETASDQLEKNWLEVREEMSAWIADNPSCPTCGTELDVDKILEGGHRHG